MEVAPVDLVGLVAVFMGCLTVLIPIAGFTARFALKPVTEAIARMRESGNAGETVRMLERRIALLEQEQQALLDLRKDVDRLNEAVEFRDRLESGRDRVEK